MTMADILPGRININFDAMRSNDPELSCIFCLRNDCEYEYTVRLPGRRVTVGIHHDCAALTLGDVES